MTKIYARSWLQRAGKAVVTSVVVLCLLLITSVSALAASVSLSDAANVLDDTKVKNAASSIKYDLAIYTVPDFKGQKADFVQQMNTHVKDNNVVLAFNTNQPRYIAIQAGSKVPMSDAEASRVEQAFVNEFKSSNDYTSATISAVNEIKVAVASAGNNSQPTAAPAESNNWAGTLMCLVGLLVIGGLVFFAVRSARRRRSHYGQPHYGAYGHGGPYRRDSDDLHHDYPPGHYPPGHYPPGAYPPGHYPPGYGHRREGMNPWVAGGLGAAAGGLLGFGLGQQMAQDNDAQAADNAGFDASEYGGGSAGEFGGGDFGGGDFGGGDFGGGDF